MFEKIINSLSVLLDTIPVQRRRKLIYICAGALIFVIIVIFWVSIRSCSTPENPIINERTVVRQGAIGQDELFLPEEPDFVPGVMLERQQRTTWTADDVMPWWNDPLKSGEKPWRDLIEKAVDEILEGVP